jgi:hypothetical protein
MNKPTIIYLLLLFSFFTSSLGEECSYYNELKPKLCESVKLDASDKSCVYINNECKELPKECNKYTGSVAAECQSINPTANTWNPFKACIYENNSCQLKEFTKCSEYKAGLPEEFCENINPSDGTSCKLVNNECTSYYPFCSSYQGEDKNTCESIELANPFKQCSYSGGVCQEKQKPDITCGSYKSGVDPYYCTTIKLEDPLKHCVFYDNKCSEYYIDCTSITGDSKENECNSNILEKYENKCLYKDNQCTEVPKTCSDHKEGDSYTACKSLKASSDDKECRVIDGQCKEVVKTQKPSCSDYKKGLDEEFCYKIQLEDKNKHCSLRNNECKEYYRGCSYISEESVCNSITLANGGKCVFKNNACTDKTMQCSEYTTILDADQGQSCLNIIPSNVMKKCAYSDYNCSEEDKLCTEFTSGATKEICEKAPTSSNKKKCVLSDDTKSCVEKDGAYFIKAFSSLLFLLLL